MHMLLLVPLTALASAAALQKRCSPMYDEDLHKGYKPPQPCWLTFGAACEPYLPEGTELTIDEENNQATFVGVSKLCVEDIAEEHDREKDGRKTYGWTDEIGELCMSEEGVLVITDMSDDAVKKYQQLTYGSVRV